jgi:hypothetical protein
MKNYVSKLLSLEPSSYSVPKGSLSYGDLLELSPLREVALFEKKIRALAKKLPFKTSSWPSFGGYREDWFKVSVSEFDFQLSYCERGSCGLRANCETPIDLAFEIFKIVSPTYTRGGETIAAKLDRIADQRMLIWLEMSSEVFHMFQINKSFGVRAAARNITWMCEELVRMGVFASPTEAFNEEAHAINGLMLSGLPKEEAINILNLLKNA